MMRYDKYKNSGIDWFADIPSHWQIRRLKDVVSVISKGTTPSTEGEAYTDFGVRYIKAENVNDNGSVSENPVFFISESTNKLLNRSILKANDLLLVIAGATTGKIAILNPEQLPANTNQAVCFLRLKNKEKDTLRYKYYFINSTYVQSLVWLYAVTSAQPNLPMAVLSRFSLYYPPIDEQNAIAQYLDTKTQAIDKKINLLSKKADFYKELRKSIINDAVCKGLDKNVKLKESGIEWIGKIPENWQIKRFKDVVKEFVGGGTPNTSQKEYWAENEKDGYLWVSIADISNASVITDTKQYITELGLKDCSAKIIKPNTILYSIYASLGKVSYSKKYVTTNQAILAIYENEKVMNKEFFIHYLKMLEAHIASFGNSNTQNNISLNILRRIFVLLPPKEEQTAIANFLDEKTQKIDAIVSNIGKQIENLRELRKTLINDVVTGKIKVVK
jgi:type I restriction enzyme S subunit